MNCKRCGINCGTEQIVYNEPDGHLCVYCKATTLEEENKQLRSLLSEALWYFSGNEDAQNLTIAVEKLGIKHSERR